MKFLHAADIHLDSPLRGLSLYADAPAERLRMATRRAFERLIDTALAEAVDFLILAGDLYDGDWRDFQTGLFFVKQMGRLRAQGIPVFLLYGNHDAESKMTRSLTLPDNVHVFGSDQAASFRLEGLGVVLHGCSFKDAATTDNLVPSYPAADPQCLNIGVLHTALEGHSAEHATYAPCSLSDLEHKGYQYWALGHVHTHQIWRRGDTTIAYPGNLQGRHIRERGAHGALLVTAEAERITGVQLLALDVLRWELLSVDIGSASNLKDCMRLVGQGLSQLLEQTPDERPLAVRVVFTGESAAHADLLRHEAQLREEVLGQALALNADRLWIEKIQLQSQAKALGEDRETQGALGTLADLLQQASTDADLQQALQHAWREVLSHVPSEVLQSSAELLALSQHMPQHTPERVDAAIPAVLARVAGAPRVGT